MRKTGKLDLVSDSLNLRSKAIAALAELKEREKQKKLVSVRIDKNAIKLMPPEKAKEFLKQRENGK